MANEPPKQFGVILGGLYAPTGGPQESKPLDAPAPHSNSDGMADTINRTEIAAQIAASEVRSETALVRALGKMDLMTSKIDALSEGLVETRSAVRTSTWALIAIIVTTAVALGGLFIATATYGDAMFGRGMNVRDVVRAVIAEQAPPASPK